MWSHDHWIVVVILVDKAFFLVLVRRPVVTLTIRRILLAAAIVRGFGWVLRVSRLWSVTVESVVIKLRRGSSSAIGTIKRPKRSLPIKGLLMGVVSRRRASRRRWMRGVLRMRGCIVI
jgi:hypothetical protein